MSNTGAQLEQNRKSKTVRLSIDVPHVGFAPESGHRCQSLTLLLSIRSGRRCPQVPGDEIRK